MKTIEQQLREELAKVNRKKFIGFCIASALETGVPSFEVMVSELKQQLTDTPCALKSVVTDKSIQLLNQI
jgi:hypothetical protein